MSRICVLYTHDVLKEVSAITESRLHCAIKKVDSERIAKRKGFANPDHVLAFCLCGVVRMFLCSFLVKMLSVSVWVYDNIDLFKSNADFKDIFGQSLQFLKEKVEHLLILYNFSELATVMKGVFCVWIFHHSDMLDY